MAYGATGRAGTAHGFAPGRRRRRAVGGSSAASCRRATTRSAGPRGAAACRSAISATGRRPRRPSRSSTASVSPSRAIVRGSRPTGTIVLLGRDSMVVNSGGEKIFVEEVEEVLRRHPDVVDAVVVGRPERALRRGGRRRRAAPPGCVARSGRAARVRRAHDRALQGAARDRLLRRDPPPCRAASRTITWARSVAAHASAATPRAAP